MKEYHKIQTLYFRDPATNHKTLLVGEFARPEFAYLARSPWVFTEKVDGTNIRVGFEPSWDDRTKRVHGSAAGRTTPKCRRRCSRT